MQEEIWKDIPEWENFYQASNLGRIKSLDRNVIDKNGNIMYLSGRILKLRANRTGYIMANLNKNSTRKLITAHRLVCISFLDNPENKKTINHKDGL